MEKGTVLILDDDPLNRKLLKTVLQKGNYAVIEAQNSDECIEIARNCHPDIILMDIHLPGRNGFETTRLIKTDSEIKDIPIIALSGAATPEYKAGALAAGCVDYMVKPIEVRSFIETMEKGLGKVIL